MRPNLSVLLFIASIAALAGAVAFAWHGAVDLAEAKRTRATVDTMLQAMQEQVREVARVQDEARRALDGQKAK